MENFFIDDSFYPDMEDYFQENDLNDFDSDEELREHIMGYADTWEQEVELADLEPIFKIDSSTIDDLVGWLCRDNEDRLPEEDDDIHDKIKHALTESLDSNKLSSLLPKLWYPSGKFAKLTKQDLLDAI